MKGKRMFSVMRTTALEMNLISDAQMDDFVRHGNTLGVPVYHSPDGRVWPLPEKFVTVVREI